MVEPTRAAPARCRRGLWMATWGAVLAVGLGLPAPAAAQTAGGQGAANQQAQFEQFLFEVMIDVVYEDFQAQGGGSASQFITFLEGALGGMIGPELTTAAAGGTPTVQPADDPNVQFEEFLFAFFVDLIHEDFQAQGGGTPAQFVTFLENALVQIGQPQLAAASKAVGATSTTATTTGTTTGTTGTTSTTRGTTTGTTTGTTGTTGATTTGTGTTGTTGTTTGTTGTTTTGTGTTTTGTKTGTTTTGTTTPGG